MTESAKLYELGFHIIPTVSDEKVPEAFSQIKDLIISNKGEVKKEGEAKKIKLAYPIIKKVDGKNEKFNSANFAWIKFVAESEDIENLKKALDENSSILRFIIVKTVDDYDHSTNKLAAEMAEAEEAEESDVEDADDSNENEDESAAEDSSEDETSDKKAENSEDSEADESGKDDIDQAIDELVEEK